MDNRDLFDLGLQADLLMVKQSAITRRDVLKLGVVGISALLAGCLPATVTSTSPTSVSTDVCPPTIPSETAGPYPADGSNASNQSLNVLALSGIVRSDIRTNLGTNNTAPGIPLNIEMTVVNTNDNCAPLVGYALYAWHCNRDGNYSMYSSATTAEDYLRGVQVSDSNGKVTFTSIFPGCYLGRWPHVHFEIYSSLDKATGSKNVVHTSQLALPEDVCNAVYGTTGYETSAKNLPQITLASDNVFSDGYSEQMAALSGDVTGGYTSKLTVGIAA
jgi:protocatechuate 3,4-dioxygenase beta subunit